MKKSLETMPASMLKKGNTDYSNIYHRSSEWIGVLFVNNSDGSLGVGNDFVEILEDCLLHIPSIRSIPVQSNSAWPTGDMEGHGRINRISPHPPHTYADLYDMSNDRQNSTKIRHRRKRCTNSKAKRSEAWQSIEDRSISIA